MSNYRRLISYIYAYEGGIKGKNIGFAKIEARNGQCKISVNVKKVYVGSSDMGVYLLSGKEEILLGTIFIRNSGGEFRTIVQAGNVENSGNNMDSCYGLTVHEVENAWQCYTTIWEDAVAHAAEVELADVTSENQITQQIGTANTENTEHESNPITIAEEIEAEIEQAVEFDEAAEEEKETSVSWLQTDSDNIRNSDKIHNSDNSNGLLQETMSGTEDMMADYGRLNQPLEVQNQNHTAQNQKEEMKQPEEIKQPHMKEEKRSPIGNTQQLEKLERTEQEESEDHQIWDSLRDQHAKIQAFDYEQGCEILTIKPQDIGLLPRETWVYGNNSFLLHGYYNYRYLILAKLNNPEGYPRYLLGVPGHYYSNEKYMASMFGFPDFVLAKKQPVEDGRFGYWYADIRLDN